MRASTFVWIAAVTIPKLSKADGSGVQWYTTTCWSTETQEKEVWYTTTCWSTEEKTIYITDVSTETDYITDTTTATDFITDTTTATDFITDTTTATEFITDTATETDFVTKYISVPVTIPTTLTETLTATETQISTQNIPTTVVQTTTITDTTTIIEVSSVAYGVTNTQTEVNTQTQVSVQVSEQTATQVNTQTETAYSQITSVSVVEKTVTVFVTVKGPTVSVPVSVPITIIESPPPVPPSPTPTLTGLVLCSSRIVNPTYTPSAPLPTDWTWGCPPGLLCKPKQVNCNFEVDLPADTYYCSLDECVVPPPLPVPSDLGPPYPEYSCGSLFTPSPSYFNVVPTSFGIGGYSLFAFGGQTATPCTSLPVTQICDGQPQAPAVTQISDGQPQAPASCSAPVTQISDGQPQAPATVTARALLRDRGLGAQVPRGCYSLCDNAGYDAQSVGKIYEALCLPPAPFQIHLSACNRCILSGSPTPPFTAVTPLLPSIGQWIAYCTNEEKLLSVSATSSGAPLLSAPSSPSATSVIASTSAVATSSAVSAPSPSPATTLSPSTSAASSPPPTSPAASTPAASTTAPPAVTQISDGQPQATTAPATFSGSATFVRAQDSWWITLLSFLIAFL